MSRHVLILGGHGKIAQLLTPMLLKRSWTVTSIIRTPEQESTIRSLAGSDQQGKLNVLVRSLEDVRSESQAKTILDEVKPDSVVWSAGAGGKGAPERTFLIDRDAATHFINAAAADPSIIRFLMVSYIASRRTKPSWWDDKAWADAEKVNKEILSRYFEAKIAADEALVRASRRRDDFVAICLRPGTLTLEPAGKVELGRTKTSRGSTSRATTAVVADLLLAAEGVKSCWLDLLDGDEEAEAAVRKVVDEKVDAMGEDEPVLFEK